MHVFLEPNKKLNLEKKIHLSYLFPLHWKSPGTKKEFLQLADNDFIIKS